VNRHIHPRHDTGLIVEKQRGIIQRLQIISDVRKRHLPAGSIHSFHLQAEVHHWSNNWEEIVQVASVESIWIRLVSTEFSTGNRVDDIAQASDEERADPGNADPGLRIVGKNIEPFGAYVSPRGFCRCISEIEGIAVSVRLSTVFGHNLEETYVWSNGMLSLLLLDLSNDTARLGNGCDCRDGTSLPDRMPLTTCVAVHDSKEANCVSFKSLILDDQSAYSPSSRRFAVCKYIMIPRHDLCLYIYPAIKSLSGPQRILGYLQTRTSPSSVMSSLQWKACCLKVLT